MKLLIIVFLVANLSLGNDSKTPSACDLALDACQQVIKAEDIENTHLKADIKALEDKVVSEEGSSALPWWGYVLLGLAGGLVVGISVR
jgi:hypothetical protein